MGTTQHDKYFLVIEYIFYFCLCGLSIIFTHGVVEQFISGKTSFSQSEEPIKDLPTIMICFSKPISNSIMLNMYEYGTDFNIHYSICTNNCKEWSDEKILTEGRNSTLTGEVVYFEKIITTMRSEPPCYKLTSVLSDKYSWGIKGFNKSLIYGVKLP